VIRRLGLLAVCASACLAASTGAVASTAGTASSAPLVTQGISFKADDGVILHATVGGSGSLASRPVIIEDGPYSQAINPFAGAAYNYVELQWRGTGESGGSLDSTGARDQKDMVEFVDWACTQSWSNGNLGLYGFSASAIVVYNSLHYAMPCVKAAALMAGTVDLYRDLLYMGGVSNTAAGLYVLGAIGEPWLQDLPNRLQQQPASVTASMTGFFDASQVTLNPTEDAFWADKTFQGDTSQIPILADTGFYDVEERGPLLAYQQTRQYGSHLLVIGAHDGFAGGTPGPFPAYAAWFDHYLLGVSNGVDTQPPVDLYLSDGSREQLLGGDYTHITGTDWPLPGTSWTRLYLSPATSGTAKSVNDGTLSTNPAATAEQAYPFVPSDSLATDPHDFATIAGLGFDQAATLAPPLTQMAAAEPDALTFTTPPLTAAVDAVGPLSLDVYAATTSPESDINVVLADVWPDGSAYPVASGELNMDYPDVVAAQSTYDSAGDVVDPYNDFSAMKPPSPGVTREYHVEMIPIGNHFAAGHRLRLYLVGTSAARGPLPPGLNLVTLGGVQGTRLILPTYGPGLQFAQP
jgi:putative CocE/NonD family hydrolase